MSKSLSFESLIYHDASPDWLKKLQGDELFGFQILYEAAMPALAYLSQEVAFGHPGRYYYVSPKNGIDMLDVTTPIDKSVDRAVLDVLMRRCPDDIIVSEESSPGEMRCLIDEGGGWIVDPVCGSANLAAGLQLLATNIILVTKYIVSKVAVVDHLNRRIIFGGASGDGLVALWEERRDFLTVIPKLSASAPQPRMIEFNMGYTQQLDASTQGRIRKCCGDCLAQKNFLVRMLGSSLPFTFVATGQLQGGVTFNVKPWDLLAGAALVQWAGGVATDLAGNPVTLETRSAIFASHQEVHAELAGLIRRRGLTGLK